MIPFDKSERQNFLLIVLFSILFLFFLQLLTDFIEAVYAFGLLATSLTIEVFSLLFLLSPLILLVWRRGISHKALLILGELILISRALEVVLDTRGKMLLAGFGVGSCLIFLPALISQERYSVTALNFGAGLTLALALSILFRTLGSGLDISAYQNLQTISWFLAVLASVLLFTLRLSDHSKAEQTSVNSANTLPLLKTTALCVGMMSVLILLYFSFSAPNVLARWTDASYPFIVTVLGSTVCLFSLLQMKWEKVAGLISRKTILIWNVLFVLSLVSTILIYQPNFPKAAGEYPYYEPAGAFYQYVPLLFMLLLFPVILIDFTLFINVLRKHPQKKRTLAMGFFISSIYLLLLIFAQIFTTVYDYIPIIGSFFRNKFWLVFLLLGLTLILPFLAVDKSSLTRLVISNHRKSRKAISTIIILIGLSTITAAFVKHTAPGSLKEDKKSIKILTYNIQQGYDKNGRKNYSGQLEFIRKLAPDIIGLQETGTNRISGGNSDVVRYFAEKLNLYSYYGPKTSAGTFGIALLSKYPITNPRTFYMYSVGEQTATIVAEIAMQDKQFTIFVTHLGNGGPIEQLKAILKEVRENPKTMVLGDFNFKPDSEQYNLTIQTLKDSWRLKWPQGVNKQGLNPKDRIDHIFVSPEIDVLNSEYLINSESDHPAVTIEIRL